MAISRTTRTHLIYQFIILTLLFLGIGYNELLPDRKFVLFLAFVPMFCYQMIILACCMELLPVPRWMNVKESANLNETPEEVGIDSLCSPASSLPKVSSETHSEKEVADISDLSDRLKEPRRWERSVANLGASPKVSYSQKSKSWMNLSDSKISDTEKSLSREGSLDALGPMSERKRKSSNLSKDDRLKHREKRASKAKSWKPSSTALDISVNKNEDEHQSEVFIEELSKLPSPNSPAVQHDESMAKSYSFPFRQKRLEAWGELKETSTKDSNLSIDMPYWQTVGYNLAVKYEARRRRRAVSSPTKMNAGCEIPMQNLNLQRSIEIQTEPACAIIQSQKKNSKSALTCINKIKTSFTNLLSKKKDEVSENANTNSNKGLKPSLSFKSKNKTLHCKKENASTAPECPQFLSNDMPLTFYPKYIPFEKERFESDVQKKIIELATEPKASLQRFGTR